jgi:hypothetical protein
MSKKTKILIGVLAAVVLLAVVGTVTVMAATDNQTVPKTLQSRIAAKLGISDDQLKNAIGQAQADQRTEALGQYLDKAVQNGKLSQDEANQIKAWWQNRPAALDKVFPGNLGMPFMQGLKMGIAAGDNRTAPPRLKVPMTGHTFR